MPLTDKIGAYAGLALGKNDPVFFPAFDAFEQPCHVAGERAHNLQAFFIFAHIIRCKPMYLIPVLRRNHGHAVDGKVLGNIVKGCSASAAASADNGGSRLVSQFSAAAEEKAVHIGFQLAGDAGIINGRAKDETIRLYQLLCCSIYRIIKHTFAKFAALPACGTAADILVTNVNDFTLNTLTAQLFCNFVQCSVGAAVCWYG